MNLTKISSLTLFFLILFNNHLNSQVKSDSSSTPAVRRCAICDTIDALPNKSSITNTSASASIDEELFLVNLLEYYYAIWPTDQDTTKILESLERSKLAVGAFRNVITRNRLDPGIAKLYDEFLQLVDANEAFVRNIRAIDQQTAHAVQGGAAEIIVDGIVTGAKGSLKKKPDKEILRDIVIDAAFSILTKGVQISRERQAAIDAEKQRLALSIADTLNSAKATAQILARKRGWYPNEANFVSSATDTASITASQRPRDYFAVYWLADVRSTDNTPASNAEAANLYLKASKLVPPDPSYNLFRDIAIQGYREVTGRQR